MGQSLSQLVLAPEHRRAFEDKLARYGSTGDPGALDERVAATAVHKSGHPLAIELHMTPIHTANETAFCAFVRDVSATGA